MRSKEGDEETKSALWKESFMDGLVFDDPNDVDAIHDPNFRTADQLHLLLNKVGGNDAVQILEGLNHQQAAGLSPVVSNENLNQSNANPNQD